MPAFPRAFFGGFAREDERAYARNVVKCFVLIVALS
jgi:hypothetical protein